MAPRVKVPKPDHSVIYVCLETFATDDPIRGFIGHKGMRLRGRHPIVQRHPERFVEDGLSDDEMSRIRLDRQQEERRLRGELDVPQAAAATPTRSRTGGLTLSSLRPGGRDPAGETSENS